MSSYLSWVTLSSGNLIRSRNSLRRSRHIAAGAGFIARSALGPTAPLRASFSSLGGGLCFVLVAVRRNPLGFFGGTHSQ
jgi:hypothetical protein